MCRTPTVSGADPGSCAQWQHFASQSFELLLRENGYRGSVYQSLLIVEDHTWRINFCYRRGIVSTCPPPILFCVASLKLVHMLISESVSQAQLQV